MSSILLTERKLQTHIADVPTVCSGVVYSIIYLLLQFLWQLFFNTTTTSTSTITSTVIYLQVNILNAFNLFVHFNTQVSCFIISIQ